MHVRYSIPSEDASEIDILKIICVVQRPSIANITLFLFRWNQNISWHTKRQEVKMKVEKNVRLHNKY